MFSEFALLVMLPAMAALRRTVLAVSESLIRMLQLPPLPAIRLSDVEVIRAKIQSCVYCVRTIAGFLLRGYAFEFPPVS